MRASGDLNPNAILVISLILVGTVALSDRLKASPQDLRSVGLEPRPTPLWSGRWRLAPGLQESRASRYTGNLPAEPRRDVA